MAIGKKGAMFTIMSIILVSSLTYFYISTNQYSLDEQASVIETRIITMNSFIDDIEHDIERGLAISAMRGLIGMTEFIAENGTFFTDIDSQFSEIMLNGTVGGQTLNITKDSNFGVWIGKIQDIANNLDLEVRFHSLSLTPFQDDPWSIKINVQGILNLTDRKGLAAWNRTLNVTTRISIEDFEDPLYTVRSLGKFTNSIVRSNITDYVVGQDATNLMLHVNNSWYRESTLAPSFLMRFSGNLSASPFGIESVVRSDKIEFAAPEIYSDDSSTIDYIYLGNTSLLNCKVNETRVELPWFRLDDNHLSAYEAKCES